MQTVDQKCEKILTDLGMWPHEAKAVLELAKPDIEVGGYKMAWGRPASEYPVQLYAAIAMILKRIGLEYIDEHCPQAWYRPMSTPDPEAEIKRLQAAQV